MWAARLLVAPRGTTCQYGSRVHSALKPCTNFCGEIKATNSARQQKPPLVGAGVRLGPRRTEMGASNSVHDLLADDPAFEPVVPRSEAGADGPDVEAGVPDAEAGAPGGGVLQLKVGLEIIHVAFPGPRSLFCACEHGSVCLVELPATSSPGHDAATFFEAAPPQAGPPFGPRSATSSRRWARSQARRSTSCRWCGPFLRCGGSASRYQLCRT